MNNRSLISVETLTVSQIRSLFKTAKGYLGKSSQKPIKKPLAGTNTLLLFYEPSTRTRASFELAAKRLGSSTTNINAKGSSFEKGESLIDTAMTLNAMDFDIAIVRHKHADAVSIFAEHFKKPVINAGSGQRSHPTQALLDAFTLESKGKLFKGAHIAIVGDIGQSRVSRSNLSLFTKLGLKVTLVGPPRLTPRTWRNDRGGELHGEQFSWTPSLDHLLPDLDAVLMLRIHHERQTGGGFTNLSEFTKLYGLNRRRLNCLNKDAIIMHPGPVNRGVELGWEAFEDKRCVINRQTKMGVAMRCAILEWALSPSIALSDGNSSSVEHQQPDEKREHGLKFA